MELFLYHISFAGILLLLTQSLSLVWRVRLFSLGHHGFYGIGAYAGVVMARVLLAEDLTPPTSRWEGLMILGMSILAGAATAMAAAWLLSFGLRRAQGDAYAVGTLLFAEIVRLVAANWDYVGGGLGFEVPYLVFNNSAAERLDYVLFFSLLVAALNTTLLVILRRWDASEAGLFEKALGDDQLAAELSGLDVEHWQRRVFVLAAAAAGGAGVVFLHFTTLVMPQDFNFINGLVVVLCVILGGMKTGHCVAATLILYGAMEIIKLRFFGIFGFELGQRIAEWQDVQIGLLLILAVTAPVFWRSWMERWTTLKEEAP